MDNVIVHLIIILAALSYVIYVVYSWNFRDAFKKPKEEFPEDWRLVLTEKVVFYHSLMPAEKDRFEEELHSFLLNVRITGIETEVAVEDRVLIGASAIIPIFAFQNWRYTNIYDILLCADTFNEQLRLKGEGVNKLGMVGTGYWEGKMVLSKKALHLGFDNSQDKRNTAIHEFVHLIDKMDGAIDGVPELILDKQYIVPWLELIDVKILTINKGKSDIRPYGGTSRKEFLTVVSEYFFERPKLLKKNHPELYSILEDSFMQKMTLRNLRKTQVKISRNQPCVCGSGEKFKKCCGSIHH